MCWYTDSRKVIEKMFGDDADLFCDILAATSPRKQVKANWRLAMRIYDAYKSGTDYSVVGMLPNHVGNVDRALSGLPLSGNKVSAFAANLKGDLNRVTIDVWVLRYLRSDRTTLTPKQYGILEKKIQRMAKRKGLLPAQYQAKIWAEAMRQAGKTPQSYAIVSEAYQLRFMFMEN